VTTKLDSEVALMTVLNAVHRSRVAILTVAEVTALCRGRLGRDQVRYQLNRGVDLKLLDSVVLDEPRRPTGYQMTYEGKVLLARPDTEIDRRHY
jgi:hypothetical protein